MNQIENIACGATEPIETQDDEFVIGAQELHDRLKLRASSARCARACFGAEDFTARCLQPGNLDVEILVDGARRVPGPRAAIHVFRREGLLSVKRLRVMGSEVELASDNPDYGREIVPLHAIEVVGRVVWMHRALV